MKQRLGDILKARCPTEEATMDVALGWIEQLEKRGKRYTLDEVEGHLEGCFRGEVEGTRFFFDELDRAMALLERLGIPTEARMDLFELADQVLAGRSQDGWARLVIDASLWQSVRGTQEQMLESLRKTLLVSPRLTPVVVLMTHGQQEKCSQEWKKLPATVRVEAHPTPDGVWKRVGELTGEKTLVVSSRRLEPFERWVAGRFDGVQVVLEPTDGLDLFLTYGKLASLPPVTHSLEALVGNRVLPQVKLPGNPVELRKLMWNLRTEEGAELTKLPAEVRLACARLLGIDATSTAAERQLQEVAQLGTALQLDFRVASQAELDKLLDEARSRFIPPTILKVGERLHLINPSDEQVARAPAGSEFHHLQAVKPASARLLDAIAQWNAHDLADDPCLQEALDTVDPDGLDRLALLHARAALNWSEGLEPAVPDQYDDWREGLRLLLREANPPPAELRVKAWHNRERYKGWTQPVMFISLDHDVYAQTSPAARATLERLSPEARRLLTAQPGTGSISLRRTDRFFVNSYQKKWYGDYDGGRTYAEVPSILLPKDPAQVRQEDLMTQLFQASSGFSGIHRESWTAPTGGRYQLLRALEFWQSKPFEVPEHVWLDADQALAFVWLALRQSIQTEAVRLHDGTVLLPLGAGIFAQLRMWHSARKPQSVTRASMEVTCELAFSGQPEGLMLDLNGPVITHLATTSLAGQRAVTELGYSLPNRIYLSGSGLQAEVAFRASPLFLGASGGASIGAAVGAVMPVVEAHQKAELAARMARVTFEQEREEDRS